TVFSGTSVYEGMIPVAPVDPLVPRWSRALLVPWEWDNDSLADCRGSRYRILQVHGWPRPALWSLFEHIDSPVLHSGVPASQINAPASQLNALAGWIPNPAWYGFRPA